MDVMENFKSIIETINKYSAGSVMTTIFNQKLNRNLLLVYSRGTAHYLRFYDVKSNFTENPVSEIKFTLNGKGCFVSAIKTEREFQRCGLATEIMGLALSIADLNGTTSFYGEIKPTDEMDGIDENDPDFYEKQVNLLKLFYEKQGASIDGQTFRGEWKSGEKLAQLNANKVSFLKNVQEFQESVKIK